MNTLLPSPLSDRTTSYLGQLAHIPLLTREGEIAKRIEVCEHEVVATLGLCEAGRDVVAELGAGVNRGDLRVRDIVRGFDEDDPDWEDTERRRILRLVAKVAAGPSTEVEAKALARLKLRAGYLRSFLEGRAGR